MRWPRPSVPSSTRYPPMPLPSACSACTQSCCWRKDSPLTQRTFTMLGSRGWKRPSPNIRRTGHMRTLTKRPEQLIDPSSKRSDARLSRSDAAKLRLVDGIVVETAPARPPRACFEDRSAPKQIACRVVGNSRNEESLHRHGSAVQRLPPREAIKPG